MRIEPKSKRLETLAQAWHHYGKKPLEIEEILEGEESVWDYPRPPSIQQINKKFEIFYKGKLLLKASLALKVCETASPPTYYFSPKDFLVSLEKTYQESECEWKGTSTYWSFILTNETLPEVAWSYEIPFLEYSAIKGLIAVYPQPFDCFIEGEKVVEQPGEFYGGWITREIKGPFKGSPGSQNW